MLSYEVMKEDERTACVDLAARAFSEYEYFSAYVSSERRRMRFLRAMLNSEFRANVDRAAFFTVKKDGRLAAVAMLCSPGYQKPSDLEYMKAGYGKAFLCGGIRNVLAWNAMEAEAYKPCRGLSDEAWYLNMLTVDPYVEGRGIGSETLQSHILPHVRENGGTAPCLFTNSEINRKFYLKNGFEQFHEQKFAYRGKTIGSWSYRIINNSALLQFEKKRNRKCSRRRDTATAPAFGTECGQHFIGGKCCELIIQNIARKRNVQIYGFIPFLCVNIVCSILQQMNQIVRFSLRRFPLPISFISGIH